MKKEFLLIPFALVIILLNGCKSAYLDVDPKIIQEEIYDPTTIKKESLNQTTVLYLDHSSCIIDANIRSRVFKELRPNLGQYSDTLVLIKGEYNIPIALNRRENRVAEVLELINEDFAFADIRSAVFKICNGNQQAVLISDCESYYNGRFLDQEPYLSEPFKKWLQKGHVIYIISEPYTESFRGINYNKKRFYIFFTDDKLDAPISNLIFSDLGSLYSQGSFSLQKLTNSDFKVKLNGDVIESDIEYDYSKHEGFDYINIYSSWEDIRQYVMKLDKFNMPIEGEQSLPLLKNYIFNNGENYIISDVEILASNITETYIALSDSSMMAALPIKIPDGFVIDKEALKENKLEVKLTDRIFNYLSDENGGNLIRLDFVVTNFDLVRFDDQIFKWQSLYSNEEAICVSRSIENALNDISIVPTNPERRIIHTVFLRTESY
jgi:hypothetical protein